MYVNTKARKTPPPTTTNNYNDLEADKLGGYGNY